MADAGPVNPSAARQAATTPQCPAQPAFSRLVHAPLLRYSNDPEAIVAAMPSAWVVRSGLSRMRRDEAAAAPSAPATPVGWKPRRYADAGFSALPTRITTS